MHATTVSVSAEPVATTVAIDLATVVFELAFADAAELLETARCRDIRRCQSRRLASRSVRLRALLTHDARISP